MLQFLGCLGLAVQWYAGGSPLDPQVPGYSFSGNYLSDLGRNVAWSGASNQASAVLFNASLGLPSQLPGDAALLSKSIVLQKYVLFGCVGWYCVFSLRMLLVMRPPEMNQFTDRDKSTEEYVRRLRR